MDSSRKKIAPTYLCTRGIASSTDLYVCVDKECKGLPYSSPIGHILC